MNQKFLITIKTTNQMKNLFITTLLVFSFLFANAQNDDYKIVVGVQAGYSLTGALIKTIGNSGTEDALSAKSIPAMQLTFDYGISKLFSIGLAASYQTVSLDGTDWDYIDTNGDFRTETFTTKFNRSQVAVRALFHYANTDKLDLYSGVRVGLLSRGFQDLKTESGEALDDEVVFSETGLSGTRFSGALTPLGVRYYFTENIGASLELNLGAPYISNVGVTARF